MQACLNKRTKGFTLIELSISLAFISTLVVAIALITSHLVSTYQRGMVLKQVNSSGSEIVEDLRSAISGSSAKSVINMCDTVYGTATSSTDYQKCIDDKGRLFTAIKAHGQVTIKNQGSKNGEAVNTDVPIFGAFCSGTYSYIWNSGYLLAKDRNIYDVEGVSYSGDGIATSSIIFQYYTNDSDTVKEAKDFRILKILDPSRSVCVAKIREGKYGDDITIGNNVFLVDKDAYGRFEEVATDLLSSAGNNELAVYDLNVYPSAQNSATGNVFYSGSFILATIAGGINIKASGNFCTTPNERAGDSFDYCSINKFNFAAQAVGE